MVYEVTGIPYASVVLSLPISGCIGYTYTEHIIHLSHTYNMNTESSQNERTNEPSRGGGRERTEWEWELDREARK